jgi:DNA polymerase-3 subunit epsilon
MPRAAPDFVAIDFETANRSPDSACAVGLVRVERGRVVDRLTRRLRPPTRRFEFTCVHGLTWRDVAREPSFAELWPELAGFWRGARFFAAHNAAFDRGVLHACCAAASVAPPRAPFRCTVALARRVWGIYPTRLDVVSRRLGIPLRHHDAASDAEACAAIVLRAWEREGSV